MLKNFGLLMAIFIPVEDVEVLCLFISFSFMFYKFSICLEDFYTSKTQFDINTLAVLLSTNILFTFCELFC